MKKIDPSTYTFEKFIENDFLYVDKTEYIYNMIMSSQMVFFAKPRRFGKSMAVSTMKAIFKGKRDLFKGLAIDSKPYDWKTYPIIHIDFGDCDAKTSTSLSKWLIDSICYCADTYDIITILVHPCLSS